MQPNKNATLTKRSNDYVMEITTCVIDTAEQMSYTTYGIKLLGLDGEVRLSYEDISLNKEFVEDFIKLCIENDASEIHIPEILEDYLE